MSTLKLRSLAHKKPHVWTWEATAKILLLIYRIQGLHGCSQERAVSTDQQGGCGQGTYLLEKGMCEGVQ